VSKLKEKENKEIKRKVVSPMSFAWRHPARVVLLLYSSTEPNHQLSKTKQTKTKAKSKSEIEKHNFTLSGT